MKYPKKNHYLTFKRMNENDVEVNNEVEDISWTMDIRTARFLYGCRKLHGLAGILEKCGIKYFYSVGCQFLYLE